MIARPAFVFSFFVRIGDESDAANLGKFSRARTSSGSYWLTHVRIPAILGRISRLS
jgi:hypothetical protein